MIYFRRFKTPSRSMVGLFLKNTTRAVSNNATNDTNSNNTTNFNDNSSTVSEQEMHQFRKYAAEWWRPGGEYDALRNLNELRIPKIQELLLDGSSPKNVYNPLKGFKVLDVGSGGGILAEPIARLGADTLGIDPLPENIEAAENHASNDPDLTTLSYKCITVEDLVETHMNHFDIVIASEVIEHVNNPDTFIDSCCRVVKPNGHIFVTTINRNPISTLLVKYAAEYLLRIVPMGTHDENKFVRPDELTDMLRKHSMYKLNYQGMFMNPITQTWCWGNSDVMNYACWAKKSRPTKS